MTVPVPIGFGVEADLSLVSALPPLAASSPPARGEGRCTVPSSACCREHNQSSPTLLSFPRSTEKSLAACRRDSSQGARYGHHPAHVCRKGTTRESTGNGMWVALGCPHQCTSPARDGKIPIPTRGPQHAASGCQLTFPRHGFQDAAHEGAPAMVGGARCRRAAGGGPGTARGLPARCPPARRPWSRGPGPAS